MTSRDLALTEICTPVGTVRGPARAHVGTTRDRVCAHVGTKCERGAKICAHVGTKLIHTMRGAA